MARLSISDYYAIDGELEKKAKRRGSIDAKRLVKIGILGTSTLKGMKEALNVKCHEAGLILKSYVGEYNQLNQEILNKKSGIYRFHPDLLILCIDVKDIFGENYYYPYRLTAGSRKSLVRGKAKEIAGLIKFFTKNSSGKVILNNFSVPTDSVMGILENKQEYGFFEMVRDLNRMLEESFRKDPRVYLFDYDNFLARCGKMECCDDKMCYVADIRLNQNYMPALCSEYMRYIKALKNVSRKCVVLDLDNTLWGGIVGEDGFDGIRLGATAPGNAFVDFQKYLLGLFERGIILAINSNNNRDEAMKVIKEHPNMVLRESNFASIKINWDNKAKNIVEIAKDLNIGLDSIIYIDDDKRNCQLVAEMLPKVQVVSLPDDAALYLRHVKNSVDLDTLQITDEDKKRGLMYAEERRRKEAGRSFTNLAGFLAHLGIEVTIAKASAFDIPRIAQLAHRTNQFNMTTRRYHEEDIKNFLGKAGYRAYSIRMKDRFGDNGLCGAVMLKSASSSIVIDSFMLSCRILGKEIENAIIAFCADVARKARAKDLVCEFIQTEKNGVAKKFLEGSPFRFSRKSGRTELWRLNIAREVKKPKFIKVITA